MKHIKAFEKNHSAYSYKKQLYWLLPTDDRFADSLKQIDCRKPRKFEYFDGHNDDKYVFICFKNYSMTMPSKTDTNDERGTQWSWMPYEGKEYCEYLESKGYKYAGKVNIPDYELTVINYNL